VSSHCCTPSGQGIVHRSTTSVVPLRPGSDDSHFLVHTWTCILKYLFAYCVCNTLEPEIGTDTL
jgi:hypothetical protein